MTAPRVSVLTAVRNGADWLGETIRSVAGQSIAHEHVVVDDGSTDATPDVAAAHAGTIRYVRRDPAGAPAALGHALSLATAPYVTILDADDLMADDERLARQAAVLDAHPAIDLALGQYREFASGAALEQGRWQVRTEPQAGFLTGAVMFRRDLALRIGFDEKLVLGWFVDFVVRAREAGAREMVTDDLVFLRRVHGANTTIVESNRQSDYLAVARAAIARRRRQC
ncbi:glycosyl transferase, family 2 [Rhizorhabdus wittichii RW1]|uniref:Glycosyl transferase, family 2 n=1 Tax=Rhizorhabdus wittichii (strain DSM 6014 / CCUG 31198 / JCM 15750 / NBRC 105917 / EY 4224 / RW1) TaxID=392499 RepID=A0A9J9LF26_RHIWR|nr:glycosyl transferase, family 2 [Rhizorhabdus wittichii RW1]